MIIMIAWKLKELWESIQSQAKLPREVVQQLKDEGLPVLNSMLPPSILMKESHQKNYLWPIWHPNIN